MKERVDFLLKLVDYNMLYRVHSPSIKYVRDDVTMM